MQLQEQHAGGKVIAGFIVDLLIGNPTKGVRQSLSRKINASVIPRVSTYGSKLGSQIKSQAQRVFNNSTNQLSHVAREKNII